MTNSRYLDVEMPERFVLEIRDQQGRWSDWGVYLANFANSTRLTATLALDAPNSTEFAESPHKPEPLGPDKWSP